MYKRWENNKHHIYLVEFTWVLLILAAVSFSMDFNDGIKFLVVVFDVVFITGGCLANEIYAEHTKKEGIITLLDKIFTSKEPITRRLSDETIQLGIHADVARYLKELEELGVSSEEIHKLVTQKRQLMENTDWNNDKSVARYYEEVKPLYDKLRIK
jgi:hypothetical protein